MKWLRIIALLVILLLLPAPVAYADDAEEVVVIAVGWVPNPGVPTNLTLTYISDYEIGISWTKGATANNTMIRAKYGSPPDAPAPPGNEPTDGYLVYYGTGNTTSDTAVNFDEYMGRVYYRAWSEDNEGDWSANFAEDDMEGVPMTLIALVVLALGLTLAMFLSKSPLLGFPCVIFWAILGGFAYTESSTPWGDWQYFLFFGSAFGMTIFSAIAGFGLRQPREGLLEGETEEENRQEDGKYFDEEEDEDADIDEMFNDDGKSKKARDKRRAKLRDRVGTRKGKRSLKTWQKLGLK